MRKERPILYSTPMIRAKLAGLKTQTRRIIKPQPEYLKAGNYNVHYWKWKEQSFANTKVFIDACPYGKVGDLLWSKETWAKFDCTCYDDICRHGSHIFKASYEDDEQKWKPSIHMPKRISRIWDEIVDIRTERLQSISREDAIAEGIEREESGQDLVKATFYKNYLGDGINVRNWTRSPVASYKSLWEKINGIGSWDENPWVWVIETKTLSTTGRP